MKKIMNWFNFKRQGMLMACIVFISLVLAQLFKQSIIANIGWVLAGILPIIHPVYPEMLKDKYVGDIKRIKRESYIGGIIVIIIGIIAKFGY